MNSTQRADALLADLPRDDRGRLKIFLGAAPGVGHGHHLATGVEPVEHHAVGVTIVGRQHQFLAGRHAVAAHADAGRRSALVAHLQAAFAQVLFGHRQRCFRRQRGRAGIEGGVLAEECGEVLKAFFKARRG